MYNPFLFMFRMNGVFGFAWVQAALAGAQLASQFFSGQQASEGQSSANTAEMAFNASEAQKQRDWEERMFGSRYQITRKDLETAGYNPLVAMGLNPGTPSGAAASAHPKSEKTESAAMMSTSALNAAYIAKTLAETKNIQAQTDLALGKVSIPGFYQGPAGKVVGSVRDFVNKNSNDAKGALKALQNLFSRGTFADA